jgi:hypothetical protein
MELVHAYAYIGEVNGVSLYRGEPLEVKRRFSGGINTVTGASMNIDSGMLCFHVNDGRIIFLPFSTILDIHKVGAE